MSSAFRRRRTAGPAGPTRPDRAHVARRLRVRRVGAAVLVAASAVAGLAAVRPAPEPTVAVQVAARDLPAGHGITGGHLRRVAWPSRLAPAERSADVTGRVLLGPVPDGEALTGARLRTEQTLPRVAGSDLVVAVPTADLALLSTLRAGDRIDVYDRSGRSAGRSVTVVDLVLPHADEGAAPQQPAVLVAVPSEAAARIATARAGDEQGRLVVALRRPAT